jgi:hypothetical protein
MLEIEQLLKEKYLKKVDDNFALTEKGIEKFDFVAGELVVLL